MILRKSILLAALSAAFTATLAVTLSAVGNDSAFLMPSAEVAASSKSFTFNATVGTAQFATQSGVIEKNVETGKGSPVHFIAMNNNEPAGGNGNVNFGANGTFLSLGEPETRPGFLIIVDFNNITSFSVEFGSTEENLACCPIRYQLFELGQEEQYSYVGGGSWSIQVDNYENPNKIVYSLNTDGTGLSDDYGTSELTIGEQAIKDKDFSHITLSWNRTSDAKRIRRVIFVSNTYNLSSTVIPANSYYFTSLAFNWDC